MNIVSAAFELTYTERQADGMVKIQQLCCLNFSLQCRKYGTCARYCQLLVYQDNASIVMLYTPIRNTHILKRHFCTRKQKPAYSCRAMRQHRLEDSTSVTSSHQGFVSHHWLWLLHAPMQAAPPWLLLGHGDTPHATLLGWNMKRGMISRLNW